MRRRPIGCVLLLTLAAPARAADATPPVADAELRAAAGKALRPVQHSQAVFATRDGCPSCHHQLLPVVPLRLALTRGVAFDTAAERDATGKAFAYLTDLDAAVQGTEVIDQFFEGLALVCAHAAGVPPGLSTAAAAHAVAGAQRPDGSWSTMDQRPPQAHGPIGSTAVNLRALQLYLPPAFKAEADARVGRARDWLLKAEPRTTAERVYRLRGLHWAGAGEPAVRDAARQLLADQRPDGGWAQLPALASDAYSTGDALSALSEAGGVAPSDAAYQRGLRYLLTTQQPDGTWQVRTRLHPPAPVSPRYFDAKFPYARDQYVSIMATTWAAAALLHALPPADRPAAPVPPAVAPPERAAWMTAALTGTATDLKKLLDAGLDPNAKTAGGTTVLMMSARDPAKVKLLLDRGADLNARAATGFTAVMVAARYRGNAGVVRALLAAGADPKPGEKVKYDASALFYAVAAGDAETAGLLLDCGADVNRWMLVLGLLPTSPLIEAVLTDNAALAALLLRRGADPNAPAPDEKVSPLAFAALGNHAALIPVLIAAGAKADPVDSHGMTPLLYAASMDFGDTAVVDALLAAGADRAARTRDGQSPLDRARKYGHAAIAARLAGADGR
jgi:ankyrin repeat protein